MEEGTRVKLAREVERYPHFVAPEGRTGKIVQYDQELIAVELDEPLEGAQEWDNRIHWYPDMFVDANFRDVFSQDVKPVNMTQ